jgi:putative SOS response-associated peptidase YedK
VSWKLSCTVLRGAVGGNADCLLDQKREKGVKQPYAIGMKDGSSFAFAGLWETWIETQQVIERRLDLAAERARHLEERRLEDLGDALFPLTPEEQSREGEADPDADPTPRTLLTFTIITCDPNELTQEFHDRMPVILDPKDYDRWLEPGDPQQPPIDLLRPYSAELMSAWKIGPDVGNVRNNRPGLIDPIE